MDSRDESAPRRIRVLLVEDHPGDARLIRELLRGSGEIADEMQHAATLAQALPILEENRADVVLLDLTLPDSQGVGTVARVRAAAPGVPVVVLTGLADEEVAVAAVKQGAQEYLVKGEVGGALLIRVIRYAVERERTEVQIRNSLLEKEILLKEIHHRVKNNLQIITSLLRLGAEHIRDAHAREVLGDSLARIRSMALIHEKLYASPNMSRIPMRAYVYSLVQELFRAHDAAARGIEGDVDAEDATLGLDTAIPCGLILNELVSNALEHAFPDSGKGERDRSPGARRRIRVSFGYARPGEFVLRVRDNGIGVKASPESSQRKSLGLEVVATLTAQLGGVWDVTKQGGTAYTITFPERSAR
jgi:two-component sensor histidine kinase/CheY-like chemotaxis protein